MTSLDLASAALYDDLAFVTEVPLAGSVPRYRLSAVAAELGLVHGTAVLCLFSGQYGISATALLRTQYEAVVRSAWLLYIASDDALQHLDGELAASESPEVKIAPLASEMMKQLERNETPAWRPLVVSLRNFEQTSRIALNSFVHTGHHALHRSSTGFPTVLVEQCIRNSNGLSHLAAHMRAVLTGRQETASRVAKLQQIHRYALPLPAT